MGKGAAVRVPAGRGVFDANGGTVGGGGDVPLSRIMFEGPEEELTATQNAQPAILAHSAAVFAIVRDTVDRVVAAAGHSLGEYSAYVTASALGSPQAAKLVRRRGELMQKAGEERPGTMAAVVGLAPEDGEGARPEGSRQASPPLPPDNN